MIPRIQEVEPIDNYQLIVTFTNGIKKLFNCKDKLQSEQYSALKDSSLFKSVKIDTNGYALSWTDDIDISENELWTKGKII